MFPTAAARRTVTVSCRPPIVGRGRRPREVVPYRTYTTGRCVRHTPARLTGMPLPVTLQSAWPYVLPARRLLGMIPIATTARQRRDFMWIPPEKHIHRRPYARWAGHGAHVTTDEMGFVRRHLTAFRLKCPAAELLPLCATLRKS